MIGRGIDQVLPYPCLPHLYEAYLQSAADYVRLAEKKSGAIPAPVSPEYIWGAALEELSHAGTDARIVNLETSVTRSEEYRPKGINYRVSPENAVCLSAASIDCCVLANNHVLDWGASGLGETLSTLDHLRIKAVGAGRNHAQAIAPAILGLRGNTRVVVFGLASTTSGTPLSWAARQYRPGVNVVSELNDAVVAEIATTLDAVRHPNDIAIVSVHWGSNWGHQIPEEQRRFAHDLIDHAGISVVHGHSSHHPKAIEVYKGRPIFYGCGDFLNDYEGIRGYDEFRNDLVLMYFLDVDPKNGELLAVHMVPLQTRKFQLCTPSMSDVDWLACTLDRECRRFGTSVVRESPARLALSWTK